MFRFDVKEFYRRSQTEIDPVWITSENISHLSYLSNYYAITQERTNFNI